MVRRSKDGRFVPRTGEVELPPRQQMARDEHGQFIPKEKVVSSKPYSRAVRELFDATESSIPDGWNNAKLTEAQSLAIVHMSMAKAGNVQVGMMIVDRAEGKVPQADEDRSAVLAAGSGIRLLADLLGIRQVTTVPPLELEEPLDAEIVPPDALPEAIAIVPQELVNPPADSPVETPVEKPDVQCTEVTEMTEDHRATE